MYNGNTVVFKSKNMPRGEYLVYLRESCGGCELLGTAYKSMRGQWVMGKFEFKKFSELKAVIRHIYTGALLPD